jgi:hypothetical protein
MGQLLQPLEAQKAGGALDRVHGAEDVSNQPCIIRPLFQFGQTALHAIKTFLALDQELPRQFIDHRHTHRSASGSGPRSKLSRPYR